MQKWEYKARVFPLGPYAEITLEKKGMFHKIVSNAYEEIKPYGLDGWELVLCKQSY